MKSYIIGISLFIVFVIFTNFQADYNKHQEQLHLLKFIAEESAAAAAQFISLTQYKDGYLVFNQAEGNRAARRVIENSMEVGYYWSEPVEYTINYFDDLNTDYPYIFSKNDIDVEIVVKEPTVVVAINAGPSKYGLTKSTPDITAVAAHEWKANLR
jgi:hypothetical protein